MKVDYKTFEIDEICCEMGNCPECGYDSILSDMIYCPQCGEKIEWINNTEK